MRSILLSLLLPALVGACATSSEIDGAGATVERRMDLGSTIVSVVGTPFLVAFKAATCIGTVAVAGPIAGLTAVSRASYGPELQTTLEDGLNANCGPPYAISPVRTVRVAPAAVEGPLYGPPPPPSQVRPAPAVPVPEGPVDLTPELPEG